MTLALEPGKRFTIGELSKRHRISQHHLTKVVHRLAGRGLIETTRGQGGGVTLSKDAVNASIGDIVRSTEPDFALAECFRAREVCLFESQCTLQHALDDAMKAFFAVLDGLTLGDLVRNPMLSHISFGQGNPPKRGKPDNPRRTGIR